MTTLSMKPRGPGVTAMVLERIEKKTGRAPNLIVDGSEGYARVIEVRAEGDAQEDFAATWLRDWMRATPKVRR